MVSTERDGMKWIGRLISIGLVFWAGWELLHSDEASKIWSPVLAPFEQAQEVVVDNSSGYRLKRENGTWTVEGKFSDEASATTTEAWLKGLSEIRFKKLSGDLSELKNKILTSDYIKVKAISGGIPSDKLEVVVSALKSFAGSSYVILHDLVYLAEGDLSYFFNQDINYFRNPMVFPEFAKVRSIKIENRKNGYTFRFIRKAEGWEPTLPSFSHSDDAVFTYLNGIKGLSADGYYSNFQPLPLLKKLKFDEPALFVEVEYLDLDGVKNSWIFKMVQAESESYFIVSNRNAIFKISQKEADKLLWDSKLFYKK